MKANFSLPKFRLFTIYALAFLVGIFFASIIKIDFLRSIEILLFATFALLLTALTNYAFKNHLLSAISLSVAFTFFGLAYCSFFEYKSTPKLSFGQDANIEGKIVAKPAVDYKAQKAIIEITKSSEPGNDTGARILVSLPHYPIYKYGDKIIFTGKIEKPEKIEDFDYPQYLKKSLVFGIISQPSDIKQMSPNLTVKDKLFRILYASSDASEAALNRLLSEPQASLAAGLILGIKRNIPDYLTEALKITGLTHIIALSGYNVTIILIALSTISLGYLSRRQVFLLGLFLVLFFVILTGAASSVIRAAIFSVMVVFGRVIGRQADFTNLILLAAIVMVLVNPFILKSDTGFQLSFLAFAGLIYLSPIINKIMERKKYAFIPSGVKSVLSETLSAQIAVTPLILTVFGRVSLISPITNILVLWIIPLSMGLTFLTAFGGMIYYPLGKILSYILWPALEYIIKIILLFSKIPLASLEIKSNIWLIELALYLFLIGFAVIWTKRYKIKLL